MKEYNICTLPNGLRIIHEVSPTQVVYCGYTVCAGTRDESPEEQGMAHFCEHMTFKGTERRRAWHILNRLECVGGDLNAYTNKEETVYYAALPKAHFPRAVELLSDIVFHSTYPQHEIDREVEVIIDEISSYEDSPSELIFDQFESMLFEGHPLAGNILGSPDSLHAFRTADARRFTGRYYRPAGTTFFVYGQVDFDTVVRLVERHTAGLSAEPVTKAAPALPPYTPRELTVDRHTHQAHVLIGTRSYSAYDPRRIGLFLLNNLLGGPGMNSRLNVSLRERNGLVYNVESNLSSYTDIGVWSIYFGCDAADVDRCRHLVGKELQRLTDKALTPSQLEAAKRQLKGQIDVSCDNFESYALAMGKVFAHYGHYRDIDRLLEQIDTLTADGLLDIARETFAPEQLTTLIYN